MAVTINAKGTSEDIFSLGKQGPKLKNNSGIIEIRNAGDTDYSGFRSIGLTDSATSTAITIDATQQIGIRETVPDGTLHIRTASSGAFVANVDTDDLIVENSTNVGLQLVCPAGDKASIHFGRFDDPDRGQLVYDLSDNTMRFTVNATEHLTLFNTGATGIGQPTPIAALDVDSNAAIGTNNAIRINAAAPAMFWETESASFHNYKVSAQDGTSQTWQVFVSDAAGADALSGTYTPMITIAATNKRVGINQSNPEGRLHVQSDTAGAVVVNSNADELVLENNTTCGMSFLSPNNVANNIFFGDVDDNDIGQIVYDHDDNSMAFITNTAEVMRFDSTGASLTGIITTPTTDGDIGFVMNGTGVLSVDAASTYESNVTDDDDIPNKKFCDDTYATVGQGIDSTAGAATSLIELVVTKTAITDNVATAMITVTIPNAAHSAVMEMLWNNRVSDDESARVGKIYLVINRVAGAATVKTLTTIDEAIATAGTETLTQSVTLSGNTGADSATQTFDIEITLDTSASTTANSTVYAQLLNGNATGITIAAT